MKRGVQWGGVGRKGGGEGETRDDKTRGEERRGKRVEPLPQLDVKLLHSLSFTVISYH